MGVGYVSMSFDDDGNLEAKVCVKCGKHGNHLMSPHFVNKYFNKDRGFGAEDQVLCVEHFNEIMNLVHLENPNVSDNNFASAFQGCTSVSGSMSFTAGCFADSSVSSPTRFIKDVNKIKEQNNSAFDNLRKARMDLEEAKKLFPHQFPIGKKQPNWFEKFLDEILSGINVIFDWVEEWVDIIFVAFKEKIKKINVKKILRKSGIEI